MKEIVTSNKKILKISDRLYSDLYNFCYLMIKQKMDIVFVIDGSEGVGKSFFSRGIARIISKIISEITEQEHFFGVTHIHFDLPEYLRNSFNGEPYQINLLDESRNVANKLRSTSKESVKFTNYLSECRSKNQVHIILLPAYHDLVKYIVNWRMSFLIHLGKKYKPLKVGERDILAMDRGYYRVFSDKKKLRYAYEHPYDYPKFHDYAGFWRNEEAFDVEELNLYDKKKDHYMGLKYVLEDDEETTKQDEYFKRQEILKREEEKLRGGWY